MTMQDPELNSPIERLAQEIAGDEALSRLINPDQLKGFLVAGINDLLNRHLLAERETYLEQRSDDRANGYAPSRQFRLGTTPIDVTIPRTRKEFYPEILPKYQRHLHNDYQELLMGILTGAKSFSAARQTLQYLGLGYSPQQFDSILESLLEEAKRFNQRRLNADYFFIYLDAKVIDLKDEKASVQKAIHFTVIGVDMNCQKDILQYKTFWGHETIDVWRASILDLKNRGLTRVLLCATDDFSGLTSLIKSLLPTTDHQLCHVHLLRNAQRHLSKDDYSFFCQTLQEIYSASTQAVGSDKFTRLCHTLEANYPAYIKHLRERIQHYLAFMNYPRACWKYIRSTNLPEGVNNAIEIIKRNAGGHFHSERELLIKMKLLVDKLKNTKWRKPHPILKANIYELTTLFKQRFESLA